MKRFIPMLAGVAILALAAGPALADDAATPQSGTPATPEATQNAPATAAPSTPATAAPDAATTPAPNLESTVAAPGDAGAAPAAGDLLARVRAEGAKVDAKTAAKFDKAAEAVVNDVEKTASTDGDRRVAERLAAEFGVTSDALLAEKSDLKASWGQLMIAHALMANSTTDVTAKQIFDLRSEGLGWSRIASGLGFRLGEVLNAAKAEARVAKGLQKADGKTAEIHGTASRAGLSASASAKAKPAATAKQDAAKQDAAKQEAAAKDGATQDAAAAPGSAAANPGSGSDVKGGDAGADGKK